jgi:hypothetical protein
MLLCLVIIPCRSLGCGFRKLGKLAFPQVQCHCFAFLGHCLTVWAASLRPPVVAPMPGKIIGGPSRFELDWNVGLLRAMSWEVTGPEDPTVLYFHGCKLIANRWSLSYCSIDTESSFLNPMIFRRYINCPDLDLERYRSCNAVVQHGYGSEKPQMTSTKQSLTEWSVINWRAIHRLSFSASLSAMLGWTNAVFPDIVSLQYAPNTERPDFDSFVIHHYIR